MVLACRAQVNIWSPDPPLRPGWKHRQSIRLQCPVQQISRNCQLHVLSKIVCGKRIDLVFDAQYEGIREVLVNHWIGARRPGSKSARRAPGKEYGCGSCYDQGRPCHGQAYSQCTAVSSAKAYRLNQRFPAVENRLGSFMLPFGCWPADSFQTVKT